jgi:hypothetical protein
VYQPDTQRTLLAKEGTNGIWPAISEFTKRAEFFIMPQSWNMGQIILLPLRRKACCGFFPAGEIRRLRSGANPRSWVPEASMLTPRPPKPLAVKLTLFRDVTPCSLIVSNLCEQGVTFVLLSLSTGYKLHRI